MCCGAQIASESSKIQGSYFFSLCVNHVCKIFNANFQCSAVMHLLIESNGRMINYFYQCTLEALTA